MLTKAGWPRPIVDGWPIPWVSPSEDLSEMHLARSAACASGAICAVCGEGYAEDEEAYALVTGTDAERPVDMSSVEVRAMDNGILHKRCALLAMTACPKLKSMIEEGRLTVVATKGNIARLFIEDDGSIKSRIDGADCRVVDRASLFPERSPK